MVKIILTDDHTIVRDGLKKILAEEADMKVIGEAGSSEELFALKLLKKADVLLLDISLPGRNGLEIISDLNEQYPNLKIVMLSMHSEEKYAERAFKNGAKAYVAKDVASDELVKSIRRILKKENFIISGLGDDSNEFSSNDKFKVDLLSKREYQVMMLVSKGKTTAAIAEELNIGVATVATFKSRILKKLELETTIQISNFVFRKKLDLN